MKKILSLALAGVMMFSALPMAYAADTQDYSQGTQVEYVANSDANRSYTITVPAKLTPKLGEAVTGTVTLSGKWASNETVTVTADAEVELTNSINAEDKHKLAITFPKMEYAGDNTEAKTYTETVTLAEMPAAALFGEWTGKFNYNVEFDDGKEKTASLQYGNLQISNYDTETGVITLNNRTYGFSGFHTIEVTKDGAPVNVTRSDDNMTISFVANEIGSYKISLDSDASAVSDYVIIA